jgi:hypothetical protein
MPPLSDGGRRFAGLIVIVFGVLFLAFGGLCSGVYLLGFFIDGDLRDLMHASMIAVPTALVGWLIIARGRALWAKR